MSAARGQAFLPAIPMIPGNRVNLLENRVSSQERTTAVLLDQAFRIKDDIVSYLQGSKGHQQGEATARQLLENHIQTITSIVKKLSHDIEVLEKQIRTRDNVATGTTFAVQSLDHKYLHGFGDLRGRVARCDASIAKLSGDINIIRHEIQRLEKEIGAIRSTSESYANNLEMKVMRLLDKIETSNSEQSSHLKTVQGDQHHELQLLDFKVNSLLNDLRDQIQDQRKWTETQLRRSEQEQAYHTDQFLNAMKERLEAAEKKLEENMHLSLKLENTNKPQQYEMALSLVTKYENKLHARITRFERQIWNELEEIQNEYRSDDELSELDTSPTATLSVMEHTLIPIRRRLMSCSGLNPYQIETAAQPAVPVGESKLKKESWSQEGVAATREGAAPCKELKGKQLINFCCPNTYHNPKDFRKRERALKLPEGFQSVHEALNSLQRIQTTKLKLEKKKFQKDIKKIRCKVTELQED